MIAAPLASDRRGRASSELAHLPANRGSVRSRAVRLPVGLCRVIYRSAYVAMRSYWFVRRPNVRGVKCVLTDGEQVLLVRHTYGHREWDLPGGKIRWREAPDRAAHREMHEELGVRVPEWSPLGLVEAEFDHRRDHMHCFSADVSGQRLRPDPCELAAVSWFPRRALPSELGRFVERILALADAGTP